MHFLRHGSNSVLKKKRSVVVSTKLIFFIRQHFFVFKKKVLIRNKKFELYKKKKGIEENVSCEKIEYYTQGCVRGVEVEYEYKKEHGKKIENKLELNKIELNKLELDKIELNKPKINKLKINKPKENKSEVNKLQKHKNGLVKKNEENINEAEMLCPQFIKHIKVCSKDLDFKQHIEQNEYNGHWKICKGHIIIYNLFFRDEKLDNVSVEILFQNNLFQYHQREHCHYLDVFYKQLKKNKINNKVINIYKSKINNIYNNLLFYYFREHIDTFAINKNIYSQFSRVLNFFFHKLLNIKFLFFQSTLFQQKNKVSFIKFYRRNPIEKCIYNYLHKLLNNGFINRLFTNEQFFYSENASSELLSGKRRFSIVDANRKECIRSRRKKSYLTEEKDSISIRIKNEKEKKEGTVRRTGANKNVFNNFHVLRLSHMFLSTENEVYMNVLKITVHQFINTLIKEKRKKKKIMIPHWILGIYKEMFDLGDIFIVDKENINKDFFFYYYHLLKGGIIFFIYNKEEIGGEKKKMRKQSKQLIQLLLCNGTKRIRKQIQYNTFRKRKMVYYLNLNKRELKTNSADHYIILFIYDLFFNKEFDVYKYLAFNIEKTSSAPRTQEYKCLNENIKRRIRNANNKVVLFTNDKKLQALCIKINLFYQNCGYQVKQGKKKSKETNIKLFIFSEHFLKKKKDVNGVIIDKNENRITGLSNNELIIFSKKFDFA